MWAKAYPLFQVGATIYVCCPHLLPEAHPMETYQAEASPEVSDDGKPRDGRHF